ncbi:MAG: glycosyltransferase family 2 protein [Candidatus Iainarchaeum sp.]
MKINLIEKLFQKNEHQNNKPKVITFKISKNRIIKAKHAMQKTLGNIDLLNNIRFDEHDEFFVEKNKPITIFGWAIDEIEEKIAGEVFVELNNELFKAKNRIERIDVSNAYHRQDFLKSGFLAKIPFSKFKIGENKIRLFILTNDNKYYYKSKEKKFFIFIKTPEKETKNLAKNFFIKNKFSYNPRISIITPVYNPELKDLIECINSVKNQIYENWELCLVDDKSTKKDVIKYLKSLNHPNIKVKFLNKNSGISIASNHAIKMATGEFLGFLDNDDLLTKDALLEVVKTLNTNKELDLIYSDEAKVNYFGDKYDYFFKPDYSPETLLSMNYICHFSVYRKSLVEKVGLLRKEYDGSQDYDLVLRIVEQTKNIHHIPKVLYYWRATKSSTAKNPEAKPYALKAAKKALEDYLRRNKIKGKVINISPVGLWEIKYNLNQSPSVEIIIPAGPRIKLLKQCLQSLLKKTTYSNYTITIIDNSFSIRTYDLLEEYKKKYPKKINFIVDKTKPFNFSKINNNVAKKSKADYLLFLNDDTQIITKNWIERLLQEATKKEAGAVGAMLLYPNNTIQHAGVVVGICGAADHVFRGFNPNSTGYFGFHKVTRNVSAVTFACAMVKKSKFLEVDGLDEGNFKVAYNDTDFCLKLLEKGYRNIYTPHAKLYHHESASRGVDTTKNPRFRKEIKLINKKWKKIFENDPYYNINLTRNSNGYQLKSNIEIIKKPYETIIGLVILGLGIIIALL